MGGETCLKMEFNPPSPNNWAWESKYIARPHHQKNIYITQPLARKQKYFLFWPQCKFFRITIQFSKNACHTIKLL